LKDVEEVKREEVQGSNSLREEEKEEEPPRKAYSR
jgi:hypothetical protein